MVQPTLQPFVEMEHENPNEISGCMLLATSQILNNQSVNETSCMCSEIHRQQNEQQDQFIEQLKINFEQELERQQAMYEKEIFTKQSEGLRVLEELYTLECDKILQCIYFKA